MSWSQHRGLAYFDPNGPTGCGTAKYFLCYDNDDAGTATVNGKLLDFSREWQSQSSVFAGEQKTDQEWIFGILSRVH